MGRAKIIPFPKDPVISAKVAGLRYVRDTEPGIRRVKHGKAFRYLGPDGKPVPEVAGVALFLIAGAILGSGLGGVQVTDRVFMVRLSPPERIGEFFGVYGLAGKASQLVGQALYTIIIVTLVGSLGTVAYQIAILSLIVTMLIGLWLVAPVDDRWAGSGEVQPPDAG